MSAFGGTAIVTVKAGTKINCDGKYLTVDAANVVFKGNTLYVTEAHAQALRDCAT